MRHGASDPVNSIEVEVVVVLSTFEHSRKSHHLCASISRTCNVNSLSLTKRLRTQVRTRCEYVIDDSDSAKPETQTIRTQLGLNPVQVLTRVRCTGQACPERHTVYTVNGGEGAVSIGYGYTVFGRGETNLLSKRNLTVVNVAEQTCDGSRRGAASSKYIVHVELENGVFRWRFKCCCENSKCEQEDCC
ncbi:hypothetical protein BRARA_G00584 [Brassica rapa]|uniref:Uncharacterized protein n=1 Tax=Brassica campestris TaxID=3711 RepID=A0A397YMI5_BRACM|nr:hypothetical protein BRARA_G00584 [Brassica rapa]